MRRAAPGVTAVLLLAVAVQAQENDAVLAEAMAVEAELQQTLERVLPAFIFVGGGSGVLISSDGYALTNNHVVPEDDEWRVQTVDGDVYKARVVGRDPRGDVVLLRLDGAQDLPHVEFGDSDRLHEGQVVFALGNPFALGSVDHRPSVSRGVISALHVFQGGYAEAIITDTPVNPGNSGGPLLTADGKLIGINGAIRSRFGMRANTGIGFAIPINQIRAFLPRLRRAEGGEVDHGFIRGLNFSPLLGDGRVPVVESVEPGSPAEEAGFKAGDRITHVNGNATPTLPRFLGAMASFPAGRSVGVTVQRSDNDRHRMEVVLTRLPRPTWFGALIEPADTDRAAEVMAVQDGSSAAAAGLQRGDLILSIDGVEYDAWDRFSEQALERMYIDRKPGDTITLVYRRDGAMNRVRLELMPLPFQADAPLRGRGETQVALGVRFGPPEIAEDGLRVLEVDPESPAFDAGLRPGDVVISVDGVPYEDLHTFAHYMIRLLRHEKRIGDTLTIEYEREGREYSTRLVLAPDWPDSP